MLKGGRHFSTQRSLNSATWRICDVLRRSNCASALQYIPELVWILFLRILDERETQEAKELGLRFAPSLEGPYRWQDWAAPDGLKRYELRQRGAGALFDFVNTELLPYLRDLRHRPGTTPRRKIIAEVVSNVERVCADTEHNFLEVLDRVHNIESASVDTTHIFPLSQVYEGLLLKMGEKSGDGGQFFTPREIVRVMVRTVAPQPGETIYDPCCGTGGFLAQSYEFMRQRLGVGAPTEQLETLKCRTFYGREKENLIYPIAIANLVLHGIDEPHIWHGNALTGTEVYSGLFDTAPEQFDVILTNPPFGGKEAADAQRRFAYKTISTQLLFLQHTIDRLKAGGRCGIVLDEGVLFRTNQSAFVQTKRKLLDECDLWCIVSLPSGVFAGAGAGVKTNLLFFTKGRPTERVWYYDLSDVKVGKKTPFTEDGFQDFFRLMPDRADGARSWTVTRHEIEAKNYDLKAVNPNLCAGEDARSLDDLLDMINIKNQSVVDALTYLRATVRRPAPNTDTTSANQRDLVSD